MQRLRPARSRLRFEQILGPAASGLRCGCEGGCAEGLGQRLGVLRLGSAASTPCRAEAARAGRGACFCRPPVHSPCRRVPLPSRRLLPPPPPPPLFFLSTRGCDAASPGPRVVPRPLASLMLMQRRRGGGQGRGAAGQGSSPSVRRGYKPLEGVLVQNGPAQTPRDVRTLRGTGPLSLPVLGPTGSAPALLMGRGARPPVPRSPTGDWATRGLRSPPQKDFGAQRAGSPRGEPCCVHLFSQLECGDATRGALGTDPKPFLWPRPLAPSTPAEREGEAQRLLGLLWTDQPFFRMSPQLIPGYETSGD